MLNVRKATLAVLVSLLFVFSPSTLLSQQNKNGHPLKVMTRNVYQGTDFEHVMFAQNLSEFLNGVTQTIEVVRATKPADRIAEIAGEIADQEPDVVGLQEATVWRTGPSPFAMTVEIDPVQLLLDDLQNLGKPYVAAKVVPQFDFTAPSSTGLFVGTTTQVAILVRADLAQNVSNPQGGVFPPDHTLTISMLGSPLPINRGWASVDVAVKGEQFRFITAHPEAFAWQYEYLQVTDLLNGPASTNLPVIMAADFNMHAENPADPTYIASYQAVTKIAGFVDFWKALGTTNPGFTCCQANDLLNPTSTLNQRIDLIFMRGPFEARGAKITGAKPDDRVMGLWPSDHAGLTGRLKFGAD